LIGDDCTNKDGHVLGAHDLHLGTRRRIHLIGGKALSRSRAHLGLGRKPFGDKIIVRETPRADKRLQTRFKRSSGRLGVKADKASRLSTPKQKKQTTPGHGGKNSQCKRASKIAAAISQPGI